MRYGTPSNPFHGTSASNTLVCSHYPYQPVLYPCLNPPLSTPPSPYPDEAVSIQPVRVPLPPPPHPASWGWFYVPCIGLAPLHPVPGRSSLIASGGVAQFSRFMNAEDLGMGDDAYTKAMAILNRYATKDQKISTSTSTHRSSYSTQHTSRNFSNTNTDAVAEAGGAGKSSIASTARTKSESVTRIRRWSKSPAPPQPPRKTTGCFGPRQKPEPPPEPEDPFIRLSAIPELPMTGPTEADSTSERDLDNASPLTLGLCEQFPCHYCIFVYSRPSDVDGDTFPFRRNELIAQINDAPHDEARRRILDSPEYRDAIRDRRVIYIEINTSCRIRLGELEGRKSLKKGLPRRRLTIAGPTFSHICVAVQLLEHMFPRLMQYALYPYRLPPPASANYTSKEKLTVNYNDYVTRQPAWLGLVPDIDEHSSWRKFFGPMQPKEI
ncbi:unnamed protein product [Schistocephalus solidus]|uniref:Uncharacterized protein n=2 Tax=Schistocephalus solidus TaxID=70667 RepID=A0A3P7CJ42_SCHSO|nr:unnamed protein product [Schistocephalus solidus]